MIEIKIDISDLKIMIKYIDHTLEKVQPTSMEEKASFDVLKYMQVMLEKKELQKRDSKKLFKLKMKYFEAFFLQKLLLLYTQALQKAHFDRSILIPLYLKIQKFL